MDRQVAWGDVPKEFAAAGRGGVGGGLRVLFYMYTHIYIYVCISILQQSNRSLTHSLTHSQKQYPYGYGDRSLIRYVPTDNKCADLT
jgi:hypothetical protein